jgi:hypothetical protein
MLPTPVAETPSAAATEGEGRDQRGRFTPGNRGGTGNPFARQVAALRKAFLQGVTPEDLAAIAAALLAKAKEGDVAAAKLVLAYAIGKPEAAVDPDRLDIDEWQTFKDSAGMMQELPDLVQRPDPELPLTMLRATRPSMTRELGRRLHETLKDPEPARPMAAQPSPSANGHNGRRSKRQAAPGDLGPAAASPPAPPCEQRLVQQPSPSHNGQNGYWAQATRGNSGLGNEIGEGSGT